MTGGGEGEDGSLACTETAHASGLS